MSKKEDAMKKLLVFAYIAGICVSASYASAIAKLDARTNDSQTVNQEIMAAHDKAIPDNITKNALCIGVLPGEKKGAFIVGGEYGQGVVTSHPGHGWSGPVFI